MKKNIDRCKTKTECQTAYFVIQAHHDHCDHDTLTYEEELAVHGERDSACSYILSSRYRKHANFGF